jgi:hypothetical protein
VKVAADPVVYCNHCPIQLDHSSRFFRYSSLKSGMDSP